MSYQICVLSAPCLLCFSGTLILSRTELDTTDLGSEASTGARSVLEVRTHTKRINSNAKSRGAARLAIALIDADGSRCVWRAARQQPTPNCKAGQYEGSDGELAGLPQGCGHLGNLQAPNLSFRLWFMSVVADTSLERRRRR